MYADIHNRRYFTCPCKLSDEEAATGNPEAVERYENYLATRREAYHKKKQKITAEKTEQSA